MRRISIDGDTERLSGLPCPVLRDGVPRTARAVSTRPRRPVQADRQPPRGVPRARGDRTILGVVDRRGVDGRRDYALLATMFNTGARVQEIVALWVPDLRLDAPAQVRLHGKGRKERLCPLWPQTADLLRALLAQRGRERQPDEPVFRSHRASQRVRSLYRIRTSAGQGS